MKIRRILLFLSAACLLLGSCSADPVIGKSPMDYFQTDSPAPLTADPNCTGFFNKMFFEDRIAVGNDARFVCRTDITEFDNDKWYYGEWDEADVFRLELKHNGKNEEDTYALRIGKGGQLYSIDTVVGEIMPQQCEHAWVDDTNLLVLNQYGLHMTQEESGNNNFFNGFIHQAGTYQHMDYDFKKSLGLHDNHYWSPIVAESLDENGTYSCITLGQIPSSPSYNHAEVLMYMQIKDVGNGIFEADYTVYNYNTRDEYGDVENNPDKYVTDVSIWGGTRTRTLGKLDILLKDGTMRDTSSSFGQNCINGPETEGIILATSSKKTDNPFAWSWVTDSDDGFYNNGDAMRNFSVISYTYRTSLKPGNLFGFRMFYVLGSPEEVLEKSKEIAEYTRYGFFEFDESTAETRPVYLYRTDSGTIPSPEAQHKNDKPAFYLYDQPVRDSKPLYLIENLRDGGYVVSTDAYILCDEVPLPDDPLGRTGRRLFDGNTGNIRLLGYAMPEQNVSGESGYTGLSSVLTDTSVFPGTGCYDAGIMVRTN